MSDDADAEKINLRIDRLSQAMNAARARARGEIPPPPDPVPDPPAISADQGAGPDAPPSAPMAQDWAPVDPPSGEAAPQAGGWIAAPASDAPAWDPVPPDGGWAPVPDGPNDVAPMAANPVAPPPWTPAEPTGEDFVALPSDISEDTTLNMPGSLGPKPWELQTTWPAPDASAEAPTEAEPQPAPPEAPLEVAPMPVEPAAPDLPPLILTDAEHVSDPEPPIDSAAPFEAPVPPDPVDIAADLAPPPVWAAPAVPSSPRVLAPRGPALLRLDSVCTDIGRYHILHGVDLEVPTGGVTMLLGRNGAGKTTTLRTIMGLWRARAGRVTLGGQDISRWRPHRIARAGIGFVPEDMGIFGDLTVAENMALAARSNRLGRDRLDWIFRAFPALETFWRTRAGDLSGGQKQMLSVARAMAEKRRLYLIDEPTKGLAPAIVDTLAGALQDLKRQGGSILMVEQNFAVATELGDTAAVMEDGRIVWAGEMAELAEDRALQARYLGLNVEAA